MRKVIKTICQAFLDGKTKACGNSSTDGKRLYLHGNLIAEWDTTSNNFRIYDAGWKTVTTKERLNGLLTLADSCAGIYQHIDHSTAEVKGLLNDNGLNPSFSVKVKQSKHNPNDLAVYRSQTVHSGRPIFWVNPELGAKVHEHSGNQHIDSSDFDTDVRGNLTDTLLHEYGHAIADHINLNFRKQGSPHQGKQFDHEIHPDEEHFAENMVLPALKAGNLMEQPWAKYITDLRAQPTKKSL